MPERRGDRGVVLLVVLFFALLLTSSIATFARRSVIDASISRNREATARADALARGGIRLAQALLLEDRLREESGAALPFDTQFDPWAQLESLEFDAGDGALLRLRIEDTGARMNLNALFELGEDGVLTARGETEAFLQAVLEKVIDELPIPPGERVLYDPRELAANLIDFVDGDDVRLRGGPEDDYYQRQTPPYRAANRALTSLEDIRLVEGFDATLASGLEPYLTVYPFAPGGCGNAVVGCGINVNTAPPHVLSLLYYDDGVDIRLASEDVIRQLLKLRADGISICPRGQSEEDCEPIGEIVTNPIFPPPTFSTEVFTVVAEARVGEVRRSVEAVVDRSQADSPRLLSWRVR